MGEANPVPRSDGNDAGRRSTPCARVGFRELLGTSAWLGLVAGLLEVLATVLRVEVARNGIYQQSIHLLWIIPLTTVILVVGASLPLAIVAAVRRRGLPGWVIRVPALVAVLTLLLMIPGLAALASLLLAAGLVTLTAPWFAARAERLQVVMRRSMPGLLGVVVVLAGGCFAWPKITEAWRMAQLPPAPAAPTNVLLIVLDTVRADALSAHGYQRNTTPNLDQWARRGLRFERAIAPSPWTLPSHGAMFTGHWPYDLDVGPLRPLDATEPTLAETLRDRGHATGGFVANTIFCNAWYGLGRGFIRYEDFPHDFQANPLDFLRNSALGWLVANRVSQASVSASERFGMDLGLTLETDYIRKDAARINRDALRWIDGLEGRPFFAFLNYFDAHDPYFVPDDATTPRFGLQPESPEDLALLRDWEELDKHQLEPRALTLARDAYDDCLAYLDDQIGRLLDALERRDLLRETLVIITSDHGEQFGEKGSYGHRLSLYQPEIHVPLIMMGPGVPTDRTVSRSVSLRDVPATVLDLLGIESGPFPGNSLARTWSSQADREFTTVLAEFDPHEDLPVGYPGRPDEPTLSQAIVLDSTSYLRHSSGREELYDLDADPFEQRNLVGEPAAEALLRTCRRALETVNRERPGRPSGGS